MNDRAPHAACQRHLAFDDQQLWQQLPVANRQACQELLAQLLIEVVQSERSKQHERED